MAEWVLRLDADDERRCQWHGPGGTGTGALTDAAEAIGGRPVTVLAPAVHVLLTRARVPTRNRARLMQAVPYALEDTLAGDVEALHCVPGTPDADGWVPAAVVERGRMDAWQAALGEAGLRPWRLLPEALALPWADGQWTVLVEPDRLTVRHGLAAGLSVDAGAAPAVLEHLTAEAGAPARARILDAGDGRATYSADALTAGPLAGVLADVETVAAPAVAAMEPRDRQAASLNLLCGDYSPAERWSARLRPWRAAAALLGVWVALQGAQAVWEQRQLAGELEAVETAVEQVFRDTFPDTQRVVNPRAQMRQALAALRDEQPEGHTGFLELLARAGPVLEDANGIDLQRLRYQRGALEITLDLDGLQGLEQLKARLEDDAGLAVEVLSASARRDRVEGRLRVEQAS